MYQFCYNETKDKILIEETDGEKTYEKALNGIIIATNTDSKKVDREVKKLIKSELDVWLKSNPVPNTSDEKAREIKDKFDNIYKGDDNDLTDEEIEELFAGKKGKHFSNQLYDIYVCDQHVYGNINGRRIYWRPYKYPYNYIYMDSITYNSYGSRLYEKSISGLSQRLAIAIKSELGIEFKPSNTCNNATKSPVTKTITATTTTTADSASFNSISIKCIVAYADGTVLVTNTADNISLVNAISITTITDIITDGKLISSNSSINLINSKSNDESILYYKTKKEVESELDADKEIESTEEVEGDITLDEIIIKETKDIDPKKQALIDKANKLMNG